VTDRERVVLGLVVDGLTNPQIGLRLRCSPRTVQSHVRSLMRKFGATTRTELAVQALRTHTVPLEAPGPRPAPRPAAVSA
jgi:DNA-binding NarL/FixJ family response regulator